MILHQKFNFPGNAVNTPPIVNRLSVLEGGGIYGEYHGKYNFSISRPDRLPPGYQATSQLVLTDGGWWMDGHAEVKKNMIFGNFSKTIP